MKEFLTELEGSFKGDIETNQDTLELYSHDASMFELMPKAVVFPRTDEDVEVLVSLAVKYKKKIPGLSLTGRGAGTDMSGGAINESVIVDFKRYFTAIKAIDNKKMTSEMQPGVMFKDLDDQAKKKGVLMPTYPASRDLCTVGGMVNNNAGGEKSIEFGKVEDFVKELEVVFADGVKRVVKPLNKRELVKKMAQNDFEGKVYKQTFDLLDNYYPSK